MSAWRDDLLKEVSPKTVNDIYLSTVRSLFARAVENDQLPENVAARVKQPKPKKVYSPARGYTAQETLQVLRACAPMTDTFRSLREEETSVNMKRWGPLLFA